MAIETPSRPPSPPPFMANAILNFHFDFLKPSLIKILNNCFTLFDHKSHRESDFEGHC